MSLIGAKRGRVYPWELENTTCTDKDLYFMEIELPDSELFYSTIFEFKFSNKLGGIAVCFAQVVMWVLITEKQDKQVYNIVYIFTYYHSTFEQYHAMK